MSDCQEKEKPKRISHPALTLQERQKIEKYLKDGLSNSQISKLLKRGKNTINVEIRRFKDRCYEAKTAQKEAQYRMDQKRIQLKKASAPQNGHPYMRIREEIEILKMQVEILTQTIREMKNDQKD